MSLNIITNLQTPRNLLQTILVPSTYTEGANFIVIHYGFSGNCIQLLMATSEMAEACSCYVVYNSRYSCVMTAMPMHIFFFVLINNKDDAP